MSERPPLPVTLVALGIILGLFWWSFDVRVAVLVAFAMLIAWSIGRSWDITAPPPGPTGGPRGDGGSTQPPRSPGAAPESPPHLRRPSDP